MKPQFGTVFLDRDGVLNRKRPEGSYVRSYEEFEWLPGSHEALQLLADCRLVIITNQRGVALGHMTREDVADIHRRMRVDLAGYGVELAGVYFCPHEKGTCDCRKPEPGMLRQAAAEIAGVELENAVMVGDSITDVAAAAAAGCPCIVVGSAPRRNRVLKLARERGLGTLDATDSLLAAVQRRLL